MIVGYIKLDPNSPPFIDERMGIKIMPGQVVQVDLTSATISLEKSISMGQVLPATADEYRQYIETGTLQTIEDYTPPTYNPIVQSPFSDGFSDGFQ